MNKLNYKYMNSECTIVAIYLHSEDNCPRFTAYYKDGKVKNISHNATILSESDGDTVGDMFNFVQLLTGLTKKRWEEAIANARKYLDDLDLL